MWRVILRYLISFGLIALSPPLVHAATPQEQYRKAISVLVGGSDHQSDMDDAARLLRIAADSGYSPAQTALGSAYEQGIAVSQDTQQAISWYKKAAEQGDWIAQFSLGRLYFQGGAIARDTAMAKKWLELAAADERDNGAAFYLGLLYDDGQGTATNYKAAEKWYRQAADRGNSFAMEKLGVLLLRGVIAQPGPASREEAYVYMITAAALGNHNVDQQLRSIEADLGKKSADAAREKSLDLRERVRSYSRTQCGGWDGQFSGAPTPPPLSVQINCEE
jgi:TPR repeat protein